ncbi:MAG: hypothetical protein HRT51_17690 [Colwellia sp.]|nr:hypothetical protein [Colwellia sp.]
MQGLGTLNCIKDEGYVLLMEEQGFLVNNRFLPIIDIIHSTKNYESTKRVFTLELVASDLSLIANILLKNG